MSDEQGVSHRELCVIGGKWLRRGHRCVVVGVEPRSWKTSEHPDAIGWRADGWSVMIEVKVSRADFLADRHKAHRGEGAEYAMGQERWYLTPKGLVQPSEVPEGWGLAEWTGQQVKVVVPTASWKVRRALQPAVDTRRMRWEVGLLLSLVQRTRCAEGLDPALGLTFLPGRKRPKPEPLAAGVGEDHVEPGGDEDG